MSITTSESNKSATQLEAPEELLAVFDAGSIVGSTSANILSVVDTCNHFVYKVLGNESTNVLNKGVITGAITYVSGNNITGVSKGDTVALYELNADNEVIRSLLYTLTDNEIKQVE